MKLLLSANSKTNKLTTENGSKFLEGTQKSLKQTAEKVVYQKYKNSGIKFAETVENSPVRTITEVKSISASTDGRLQQTLRCKTGGEERMSFLNNQI